jgi:hypothetical protein
MTRQEIDLPKLKRALHTCPRIGMELFEDYVIILNIDGIEVRLHSDRTWSMEDTKCAK